MTRRLSLSIQTAYADLLDKAQDAELMEQFPEAGNYVSKTVKGRRYWYYQSQVQDGGRAQRYVGPESPELLEKIKQVRQQKQTERERRDVVRSLVRGGLPGPTAKVGHVLESLARAGVFRLRAVLVGTMAYQSYMPMLGARFESGTVMTEDVDVAQFRSISIAVEDEIPRNMLDTLRDVDPSFEAVTRPRKEMEPISYVAGGLKVEFLTPMRGPDESKPVPLKALQTSSQSLRFMDFLIYQEVKAVALFGSGVLVNVPDPTRYALHKLIISQRRSGPNPAKAKKDLRQAESLLSLLVEDRPYDVKDFWQELCDRSPRWQDLAERAVLLLSEDLREQFEGVVDRQVGLTMR